MGRHGNCWIVDGTCLVIAAYLVGKSVHMLSKVYYRKLLPKPKEDVLASAAPDVSDFVERGGYVVATGVGLVLIGGLIGGVIRVLLKD